MSRTPVDILRPGPIESRGNSSDDSEENGSSFGWNPSGSRQIHGSSGASSTGPSTGFSGLVFPDGGPADDKGAAHLTRAAVLNKAGRRYDRKTKDLIEKNMERYNMQTKFTYFSDRTDLMQGDTLFTVGKGESMETLKGEPFFWIDVNGFSETDLSHLATNFAVHPLTIEDIQQQDNREKCEIFEHYIFICIRTLDHLEPSPYKGPMGPSEPVNVYMIIFKTHILTVHRQPILNVKSVLKRIYPLRNKFELSADWVGYALIDDIVDEFMPNLRTIELEVDSIDDLVLVLSQSDQAELLRRIGRARKRVTHLMRLLKPKTDILKALAKRCPERLKPHTLLYIRDIQDHLFTMVQNLDHYSETLNRSHNNYLAQISIELNAASNRMDNVVKKLTGAAFFMLPLSLISSIWGMNIPVPGDSNFTSNYGPFFVILSGMALIVAIMYFFARKNDWL